MIEIGLQALVAVLLAVTIAYAVMLNRRLSRLRDGRDEMARLVDELNAAMNGAEAAIATLRKTAFEDDEALGRRIAEARTARDEIGFLVDRAGSLSARLDEQIGAGRRQEMAPVAAVPRNEPSDGDALYDDAGDGDGAAARAARATATAWLRSRRTNIPAPQTDDAPPLRALR